MQSGDAKRRGGEEKTNVQGVGDDSAHGDADKVDVCPSKVLGEFMDIVAHVLPGDQ